MLPVERPKFTEIKTRLLIIKDMYTQDTLSQTDTVEEQDADETIEPQPPIRLSYHSMSPVSLNSPEHFYRDSSPLSMHTRSLETSV